MAVFGQFNGLGNRLLSYIPGSILGRPGPLDIPTPIHRTARLRSVPHSPDPPHGAGGQARINGHAPADAQMTISLLFSQMESRIVEQ